MITPADLARMLAHAADDHAQNPMEPDKLLYTSQSVSLRQETIITPNAPTPAIMPQRRATDGPTTFASLDAQELPVVREYSAGGLVFDDKGRVAIIARHSRSDIWNGACRKVISKKAKHRSKPPFAKFTRKQES